jgi:RNA polymerase sigma-54 factor
MQEIADKIGVNVSTVSRAISGKYFQAPGMVRELKSLFTGGTTRDDGTPEARGSVIQRIKDLIAAENRRKPFSDSKIVSLLAKDGIHISRRTVTKYREAEGIPSSRERRSY